MIATPSLHPQDAAVVALMQERVPGLRAVYRYGSAGTEFERSESDIDLAVLADRPVDFARLFQLSGELSGLTGKSVDLHDMHHLPVTLRVQIVTAGQRIFAADFAAAEEYDSRVLSDYAYLNEARCGILEDVRMRGSIHG